MPLPASLDVANIVLFLGSGFSREATNIANTHPPIGRELAAEFERQLGVAEPERGRHELKVLADEMARLPNGALYQTLYRLFTISQLSPDQSDILSRRWLRIFTTNYDDAAELGEPSAGGGPRPNFSWDDDIPRRIPTGSIVHIHGVIRKTTEENVLDQLVLNENSYIRQHFEKSPWYFELDRNLDHCSACFFLGYSLSDYHIAALLLQKPSRRSRIFFITREDRPDEITKRQLEQFGEIHPIGISGFAKLCRTLPAPSPVADIRALRRLRYVDPFRDQKAVAPPTSGEIRQLVTFGEFNAQRCLTNLPAANYVVPRASLAAQAANELASSKTLLVHSYLGNGKSIFLTILAHKLSTLQYRCFVCSSVLPEDASEIRALEGQEKIVILFDSYDIALQAIPVFEETLPSAKYVVAVRTGVQDVRLHEVYEKLPGKITRMSVNKMSVLEREQFADLLDKSGVLGSHSKNEVEKRSDFREIVTSLYNNAHIRNEIAKGVRPLLADEATRQVLVMGLLLSWIGSRFEPALIRAVTGRDPYVELRRHAAISAEIFQLDEDTLDVRSPIFAEYLLKEHCSVEWIIGLVERLVITAVQRKRERGFGRILSRLMRVATLREIVKVDPLIQIEALFQRLQRDIGVNAEPLFWLQYAILLSDKGELEQAEAFLDTAYSRAATSRGFETYQIDTYALGLLLRIEGQSTMSHVTRFEKIIEKSELVHSMIEERSKRWHAIQVLEEFQPFAWNRAAALTTGERAALVFQLNRLIAALKALSPELRAETGSDLVKRKLENAIQHVLKV